MSIFIGLDVGTSGTKAIAVDHRGNLLSSALMEYSLHAPRPGWAEQDPKDWEQAAFSALHQLTQTIDATKVRAMGLTGQMHGSVFLDENRTVLRNALLWCDQRTTRQCAQINERVGCDKLIEMVCNPALTGFTAPKILWLRDNEPENYARLRQVLLPKDYIRLLLTGESATDVADASGTLLFDVRQRKWHQGLMSLLDIDPAWMPPACEGPEITGRLTAAAAQRTGLPAGTPVVAGGGDQAAGAVGCGIVRTGVVSAALGTSGVVFAFSDDIALDLEGRVHTFCHAVPGKWHVMGVVLSAGGALRWFRDALCKAEKEAAIRQSRDVYDLISENAAAAPIGAEGLLFLPYLTGERTPHKDPYARGAFIGLSLRHDHRHMARAVMEGVAYAMRDSVEIIRHMKIPVRQVRCMGGGARSKFWRQMHADVFNAPMVTINVDEGPAYGAAILAAVGAGEHPSVEAACDAMIQEVTTTPPIEANVEPYSRWFHEYQDAYCMLRPNFERIAHLVEHG